MNRKLIKKIKKEHQHVVVGTSQYGSITATYAELAAVFGLHNSSGDHFKTTTEWNMKVWTSRGWTIFTIYDSKETNLYHREANNHTIKGIRTKDRIEWFIGCRTEDQDLIPELINIIRMTHNEIHTNSNDGYGYIILSETA